MNSPEQEQSPDLREYYYILDKHKRIIIAFLIVIVTVSMLFTFLSKPVYRSTAILAIEKERSRSPLTGESLDYESYLSQSITMNTHLKLITSRPVMKNVARSLKLDQVKEQAELEVSLFKKLISQFKENIRILFGREKRILSTEERIDQLARTLINKANVELVRDTILLRINVEDYDPVRARDIANSIAKVYIEFNISNRLKYSQNTLTWMTDQLYEVKKRLEDAEAEFLEYKQDEKLFSVEGKQKVIDQKISEFNDTYLETRNKRLSLDAKLTELKNTLESKGDLLHARALIDNTLVDNLYSQLLELEVELSRLAKVYKDKHPKVVQIKTEIDNTRQKLKLELDKEIEALESERAVLISRENVIQQTLSDFEDDALNTNKKELRYTILQRNVETNQNLYDTLLSKVKEANISGNVDSSTIRITEEAVMPSSPVKPKKKMNFLLSIIFGLMAGVGVAFLLEYLDRSIRTEEDVTRYLDLPVISIIPAAESQEEKVSQD